jgi:hypothetical protein
MVTKVDISDMTAQDLHWQGTSFSSPRVAGYITDAANDYNLKVVDVLKFVRKATQKSKDHILTYELLVNEINSMNAVSRDEDKEIYNESITDNLAGTKWYMKHRSKLGSESAYEEWEFLKNGTMKVSYYKEATLKNVEYSWRYFYDKKLNNWKIWNMNSKDSRAKYLPHDSEEYNAEYINVERYKHSIPHEDFYDYFHSFDFLNSMLYYGNTYLLTYDNEHLMVSNYTANIHTLTRIY